jgi:hypothetical protein
LVAYSEVTLQQAEINPLAIALHWDKTHARFFSMFMLLNLERIREVVHAGILVSHPFAIMLRMDGAPDVF